MPPSAEQELFREVQPLHQNMIVRIVLPVEALITSCLLIALMLGPSRQQWPTLLVTLLLTGFVMPLGIANLRLVTIVTDRRLIVRFRPMPGRVVDAARITHAEAVRYDPMTDAGGWGWRMCRKYHRVFNVSGDRGVHVRFGDGPRDQFLVGSRRAEELAEAIGLAAFAARERDGGSG